jgi:thiamine biosynthesis lipoprotein
VTLDRLLDLGFERADLTPVATEAFRVDGGAVLITTSRPAMGTLVSISALGRSQGLIDDAIGQAFAEMDRLIAIFSRFEPASALTALNDVGRLDGPPPELAHVVSHALRYHALTQGAFDITVEPLLHPDANRAAALALVGAEHVTASKRAIRFGREGMGVTLDGIAKGYIIDAMARALSASGVRHFLINAGGDIRAAGTRENGRPWTVGVWDPDAPGLFPDIIHLTDAAVATSGKYARGDHIVDAATGRSPNHHRSVSALAPTTIAADALATALFVLDAARGLALVESLAHCECLILDSDGRQFRSSGWRKEP